MKYRDDSLDVPWTPIVLWSCAIGVVLFLLYAGGFISFSYWAPKYEQVRRTTFEQSASHVHGKRQYLVRLHAEWQTSDENHKQALCAVARYEASTLPSDQIPNSILEWECVR